MRRLSSRQVAASSTSGPATGYLWRTLSVQRSLLASLVTCRIFPTSDDDKSRQNPQIRREIRKKNFRDKFFSDGNLSVSVSFNFFPLAFFSQSAWHYMCHVTCDPVSTNEIADATRGAQTHCAVEPPYWFPSERPDGGFVAYLPILCFFTLYFGLIVVVKPKKTLSGLHWLSFSFERSRISTGEVSSWGRMNHLSCRHSHYLPRAAGGWIGFTEDIHDLWLQLDLKEMFLKMSQGDF